MLSINHLFLIRSLPQGSMAGAMSVTIGGRSGSGSKLDHICIDMLAISLPLNASSDSQVKLLLCCHIPNSIHMYIFKFLQFLGYLRHCYESI